MMGKERLAEQKFLGAISRTVDSPEEAKTQAETELAKLSDREQRIIKLHYGFGDDGAFDLEEIGRMLKLTREHVRQIEVKAIRKLTPKK